MTDAETMRAAFLEQTAMVDRLCEAVDRETNDTGGGEGSLTVLHLLGPINDRCIELLGGRAMVRAGPAAERKLDMCKHGADRDTYCGYCNGYSKGTTV